MDDPILAKTACGRCHALLGAGDKYCRHCGAAAVDPAVRSPSAAEPRPWENPWVVLSLLFLGLGPFALPMLWRSRRFTRLWKGILTALVIGVTLLVLWLVWFIIERAILPLRELIEVLGR